MVETPPWVIDQSKLDEMRQYIVRLISLRRLSTLPEKQRKLLPTGQRDPFVLILISSCLFVTHEYFWENLQHTKSEMRHLLAMTIFCF